MKDKSTKQPWPRSAKITVWVLGVVLALSFVWHMSFRIVAYDYLCNLERELSGYKVIEDYSKFDAENDVKLGINRKEGYWPHESFVATDSPNCRPHPYCSVSTHLIHTGEQRASSHQPKG